MGGGAEPRPVAVRPGPGLRIARLVTELTAPAVLVSLLMIAVSWHSSPGGGRGLAWGLLATLFVTGIPFAYILGGVRRGRFTDHHIGRREQRRVPLLVGLGSVTAGLVLLTVLGAPRPLLALAVAGLVGLVVAVSVSHWWKMSIHSAVAAGTLVILAMTFGRGFLVAAPLLAVVGWSRVRLRDHTVPQVLAGGVVGALIAALAFGLLR
ncbi:phosphatase PAP2 family protein [Micromonospora profundi]|uniref:Phosphatase PAP2 family protein n=1 Tax=Micromonospora profundi TaxID=1420889 RepID=A0AAJ6HYZ9_9ACTN|nr:MULTISPECIES: phosphatase PAP2 family protein [Micromonospora]NJC15377.1 membrane-associated phospholipid phosphatase [Micromonospora profundi]WLS46879.1 phosphatase PAP2 family protein [Micromonospora profundi]